MIVFFYVTVSPMNILQMAPLFFFGATLIFIGYDLLYEWVRATVCLSVCHYSCRLTYASSRILNRLAYRDSTQGMRRQYGLLFDM